MGVSKVEAGAGGSQMAADGMLNERAALEPEKAPLRQGWRAFLQEHKHLTNFAIGGLAGMAAVSALQPLDVVKTRVQAQVLSSNSRVSFGRTANAIVKAEGPRALWNGVGASCMRVGLGQGLYFFLLGRVSNAMWGKRGEGEDGKSHKPAMWQSAITGATTRTIAGFMLCPVTVVKTRMVQLPDSYMPIDTNFARKS